MTVTGGSGAAKGSVTGGDRMIVGLARTSMVGLRQPCKLFCQASLLLVTLLLAVPGIRGAPASFRELNGQLLLDSPRWMVVLDAKTGAIQRIEDRTAGGILLKGTENPWVIERHKQPDVCASDCAMRHAWDEQSSRLTLDYENGDARVTVVCRATPEGPLWQATVCMKQGTMLAWRFPDSVEFNAEKVDQFIMPDNLGLAFLRSFFLSSVGVQRKVLGGKGLLQVAGDRCRMRPVQDNPVALTPGEHAAEWLPRWYLNEMARWKVTANRCPAANIHELSLAETEHGCWLSGYRLGGWGWLFRFGGMLQMPDTRCQIASVIATLTHVCRTAPRSGEDVAVPEDLAGKAPVDRPKPPRYVGILLAPPTSRPGARQPLGARSLATELRRQPWITGTGMDVVVVRDAKSLRMALRNPREWFAIVNLIPEGILAESEAAAESMLRDIRQYVRDGGVWWDAGGGYSFHSMIVPQQNATFRTANRDFCDFVALDSELGRWSLFGVQPLDGIYVPSESEIVSAGLPGKRTGRYTHRFRILGETDKSVPIPSQQMVLGTPHREVLGWYEKRNGFVRKLTEKASPAVVEKLKRCVLLKVSARSLRRSTEIAQDLPFPVLFHIADYLHGGFDKQYPDHLPPNPAIGTPEDLTRLIQMCRKKGHLFMPYTNPTWWCTNPQGPTFQREGEAPLARDLNGQIYPERYGAAQTQGYTICAWHPAVQAANAVIRRQFTEQYPVDVLFQDQVGARRHRWDTNPAAPSAGAYLEGIHRIARADSAFVPLGTEDGQDRLINWETIFSGLSWPWLPNEPAHPHVLYGDLWPEGAWKIEPMALFLAHDKVLFYHHDLGGFVRNRLDLSITLVMGYGLSWWTHTNRPSARERDWIERLCRLQAAIGPQCAGRPLNDFQYLGPQVIRSRWVDLEIVANLKDDPCVIDATTMIAPYGFLARSPTLTAGILTRVGGRKSAAGDRWIIRQRGADGWSEWTAANE